MRSFLVLFLLAAAAGPAAAQVSLGAELGPDAFLPGEDAELDTFAEEAFAWALSVEVSSSALYTVFESTAPEEAITGYLCRGIYRQELAALLLLSEEKGVPFSKLAGELSGAGGFSRLAGNYGADAMALFAAGGRLKEAADARVPLFLTGAAYPSPGGSVAAHAPGESPAIVASTAAVQGNSK
ncbi:MAG TPA: hypothetical protein PKI19_12725 [Elusimicrobiales bacterium]|nr:hypothetical protein [Elusimicrobiales bacterium]